MEGFLWKVRVVTITHGNIYVTKGAAEQTLVCGESGLRKYSAILAPMEGPSWKERQQGGNLGRDCVKCGLNLILSSDSEFNRKQGRPTFRCNQPFLLLVLLQISLKRADLPRASPSSTSSRSPAMQRAICDKYVSFQSSEALGCAFYFTLWDKHLKSAFPTFVFKRQKNPRELVQPATEKTKKTPKNLQ